MVDTAERAFAEPRTRAPESGGPDPAAKRVLMIAYHFPPLAGSSGIQRTLRFVQHLPAFGWEALVLTADPRAYDRTSADLNADIPAGTVVERAFALDTARHLAFGGRYIAAMARPDRWVSWKFDAVRRGLRLIRELKPHVVWSTYPIATAHLIGAELHRRSGLPWIADFRDPMAQDGYPPDPETWRQYSEIERVATRDASWCTFTTPGAARIYRKRYPAAADRIVVLENGYDEESFAAAEATGALIDVPLNPGSITLLHSGIVYPGERNPTPLFAALARLRDDGAITQGELKLRFRAAVHDDLLRELAARHDLDSWVEILPPVGYQEALHEMLRADALLVMQGNDCNEQIPAKVYEYLRAARPILGLADPPGDTAAVLREAGHPSLAALESVDDIAALLPRFVESVRRGEAGRGDPTVVRAASRRGRAEGLAGMLNSCRQRAAMR